MQLASVVLAAGLVMWAVIFVPPHMDEFTAMHRIACGYEFGHLNRWRESCSAYRMEFGGIAYHRAFWYIGASSGVIYAPFWKLWPSPASFFALGVLFLAAFAAVLVRALRSARRDVWLTFCFFPIAYQAVHDAGPVRLALLAYPVTAMLVQRMITTRSAGAQYGLAAAAAALLVVCVEDKAFNLYLLPSIALFVVGAVRWAHPDVRLAVALRANRGPVTALLVLLAIGVSALLLGAQTSGGSYLALLVDNVRGQSSVTEQLRRLLVFGGSFPEYADRNFQIADSPIRWGFAVAGLCTVGAAVTAAYRAGGPSRDSTRWFIASVMALAAGFVVMRNTAAGHHFVFMQVPVLAIMLVAIQARPAWYAPLIGAVMVLTVATVGFLAATPMRVESSRERRVMFDYFNQTDVARGHLVTFSSFGGYPQQALYGDPSQIVTYSQPLNGTTARQILALADSSGRRVLHACHDCTEQDLRLAYATGRITEVSLGLRQWKVFRVDPPREP